MKTTTPLPEELVPMTPAVFNILLALADRKRHGYAIMQEVETNAGGMVMMGSGTLYGSIKGMLAVGLNEESVECPDLELDDQRHRYYRLTSLTEPDIIGMPAVFDMPNVLVRMSLDHDRMFTY